MVDTKRQELVDFYFQKVQDKIQELLSKDKKLKEDDIKKFNDAIFTQEDYGVRKDLQTYIDEATNNAVDVDVVAKSILNKFYDMVFLNNFNKDTINDVDNPMEEKKLLNFKDFVKENNSQKTYFIPNTSWFDTNTYDSDKMKETIALFLNEDSWLESQWGVDNQPEVVCFLSNENLVPKIVEKLREEFDTQWIRVNEKDW